MKRNWYRVQVLSGHDTYCFYGSSEESENTLMDLLQSGRFVYLEDLIFFDEDDRPRSWSEWDPNYQSRVYLNARYIIDIMPMTKDPRLSENGDGSRVLTLPNNRRTDSEEPDASSD